MPLDVTILICTHNRAHLLEKTLETVRNLTIPAGVAAELLIIDNGSIDDTEQTVQRFFAEMPFPVHYFFERRQGKSYALNEGIKRAKGRLICFTDDDVLLDRGWLAALYKAFQHYPDASGFGGRVVGQWPQEIPHWFRAQGPKRLAAITPHTEMGEAPRYFEDHEATMGCNSAFPKRIFDQGFSFRTELGYKGSDICPGEDTEFAYALMRKGHKLLYVPEALIFHPTEEQRLTKEYVRSRYYKLGRSLVRAFDRTKYADLPRMFGVYRYLIPQTLSCAAKWVGHRIFGRPADSFYYETKLLVNCGMIRELRTRRESFAKTS